MLKAKEMRDQSIEELDALYERKRKELFELKNMLKHTKKLEQPHLISMTKTEIARLLTIINEKRTINNPVNV